MKKLFILLTSTILSVTAFTQAPQKISYQAVVRDAGNSLVASSSVGMQLSILQGTITGTAVYVETQTPTTNNNGLVSIEIGSGTVVSGNFNSIDWSNGPYFIKTETDPTGGTNYTITGTSELMSVPYALHANMADSLIGGITETDPLFGASIASGITAIDTANWNVQLDEAAIDAFVSNNGYANALQGITDTVISGTWINGIGNGDSGVIAPIPTHSTWHFDVVLTAHESNSNVTRRNLHKEFIVYREWNNAAQLQDLVIHYDQTTGESISVNFGINSSNEITYSILQTSGISSFFKYNLNIRITKP